MPFPGLLLDLPPEALLNVLSSLSARDLTRLRATSKGLQAFTDANQYRLLHPIIARHQTRLFNEYADLCDSFKLDFGDAFVAWFDHYGSLEGITCDTIVRKFCTHWVDYRPQWVALLPISQPILRQWLTDRLIQIWEHVTEKGFRWSDAGHFEQWMENCQNAFNGIATWSGDASLANSPITFLDFFKDRASMPGPPGCLIALDRAGQPIYKNQAALDEEDMENVGLFTLLNVSGILYTETDLRICVRSREYYHPSLNFGWTSDADVTLLEQAVILEDAYVF